MVSAALEHCSSSRHHVLRPYSVPDLISTMSDDGMNIDVGESPSPITSRELTFRQPEVLSANEVAVSATKEVRTALPQQLYEC